jgi:hypothetical protein
MSSRERSLIVAIAIMATVPGVFLAGCSDDPFYPRPPQYQYTIDVTGLEGFSTKNGSAMIMVPIPSVYGEPILKEGWWPNNRSIFYEERHGTTSVAPAATECGPMLAISINMTDYYYSYARVTPIPIYPGQNMSEVPTVVPDRIDKAWSFDNASVIASGYVRKLDYPTSTQGRQEVSKFLDQPLLPVENGSGAGNYTSYIYLDEGLVPLNNDSSITVSVALIIHLNHNKMNASAEGARSFEIHTFAISEPIRGGMTGFIPVTVQHSYYSSPTY